MVVRLVVEQNRRRREFTIRSPRAILGRARGCAVRIPSPEVSRQHCELTFQNGLVTVEDLDSVNGTQLNGDQIRGRPYLRPGDRLTVGPVTFVVEYELSPAALARLRGDDEVLEFDEDGEVRVPPPRRGVPTAQEFEIVVDDEDITVPAKPLGEDALIPADFTFDGESWELPEGADLRDILSQMEDEAPPPPRKKKKP